MGLTWGIMRDELETESRWQENEFHKWDWKKRGHWEREQSVCVRERERERGERGERERESLCLNLPHISPSNSVLCVRELSNHSNFMVNLRGFSDFWQTTLVHHRKWRKGGTHTSQTKTISPSNSTDEMHFLYLKTLLFWMSFPLQKACMLRTWGTQLVCI